MNDYDSVDNDSVAIGRAIEKDASGHVMTNTVAIGFGAFCTEPNTFVVAWGDPQAQVVIHSDGRIVLPESWKPEDVALQFWKTLGTMVQAYGGGYAPAWTNPDNTPQVDF